MVRHYKRKTTRQYWSEEAMRSAIKVVISEKKIVSSVANEFNLPYTTLYDKIKNIQTMMQKN